MDKRENIKKASVRLKMELSETLAPFYLILVIICVSEFVGQYFISQHVEVAQWMSVVGFVLMALLMFAAHYFMVRKPLYSRIDFYLKGIADSQLSGDELLKHGLLPDNKLLRKFYRYSIELRNAGLLRLYSGLVGLTISEQPDMFPEYSDIMKIIKSVRKN